jgi:hypothetical protein
MAHAFAHSTSPVCAVRSACDADTTVLLRYPTVSFHALQRAQKTIADFVQSYLFVFHAPEDPCTTTGGETAGDSSTSAAAEPTSAAVAALPASNGVPSPGALALMFRALPLLTYVSGTIYQLDEENEERNMRLREQAEREEQQEVPPTAATAPPASATPVEPLSSRKRSSTAEAAAASPAARKRARPANHSSSDGETAPPSSEAKEEAAVPAGSVATSDFSPADDDGSDDDDDDDDVASSSPAYAALLHVLQSQNLLTPRVRTELRKGQLYWQLERQICAQMRQLDQHRRAFTSATALAPARVDHPVPSLPPPPSLRLSDVHLASACKSFDYRVLHLLLFGLTGRLPDDALMTWLHANETLVDLHDDLVDYEDDVLSDAFNVYRCYVALFGAEDAPTRIAERIAGLEERFDELGRNTIPKRWREAFAARERRAMDEADPTSSSVHVTPSGTVQLPSPRNTCHRRGVWSIPPPIVDEAAWRREVRLAEQASQHLQDETSGDTS